MASLTFRGTLVRSRALFFISAFPKVKELGNSVEAWEAWREGIQVEGKVPGRDWTTTLILYV